MLKLDIDNENRPPDASLALWRLGFRPFYLLAGMLAAVSVFLWVAQASGWIGATAYLQGPLWHAHEMIFGYAFAVIVGFLFTAVRNWAGQPTPSGNVLAAIASLWLAGRFLVLTPWPALSAITDMAFAIAAAAGIGVPLIKSRNQRNYFFIAVLLAIGAANLVFVLAMAGIIDVEVRRGIQLGLDLVMFIMVVMGGRVIPMFTANAIPGTEVVRLPWLERLAPGSVLALLAADLLALPLPLVAGIASVAAAAHAVRLALWRPWRTTSKPILWILHAAYLWIVIHLLLRAFAAFDLVAATIATHALTVGAIGGLTVGMMSRTSRGHTGRPLQPGGAEVACYSLVQLAAIVRVLLPIVVPGWYMAAVIDSGLLWSLAFLLFAVTFWPILTRARLDGKPG